MGKAAIDFACYAIGAYTVQFGESRLFGLLAILHLRQCTGVSSVKTNASNRLRDKTDMRSQSQLRRALEPSRAGIQCRVRIIIYCSIGALHSEDFLRPVDRQD